MKEVFKVYEEREFGYEFNSQIYDVNDVFAYLDYIVYEVQPNTKVLVIRHDIDRNFDESFYLHMGIMVNTVSNYEDFKHRELMRRKIDDIQHGRLR